MSGRKGAPSRRTMIPTLRFRAKIILGFAAAWWYGIRTGIRLDREAGERAREQAAWEAAHPEEAGPGQQPQSP